MSSAPGEPVPAAMEAEFDAVAAWTEQVVRELGQEYAVVAGCRGSGSPAGLAWLCEALELQAGTRLLDAGAGVGGPAAYARDHYGADPVLLEPMVGACIAAHRVFGLPTVAAWSQQMPFADESFEAAWCLGVLCTTTEKAALLRDLRRVLMPNGQLGLLVLVQEADELETQPEGNSFPRLEELLSLLDSAGFLVVQQVDSEQIPPSPVSWQARVDRVEDALEAAHGEDPVWRAAQANSAAVGALLREGQVKTVLLHCVAV